MPEVTFDIAPVVEYLHYIQSLFSDVVPGKVLSSTDAERSTRPVAVSVGWRERRVSGKPSLLPRSSTSHRG